MKYYSLVVLLLSVCIGCQTTSKTFTDSEISIVPKPSSLVLSQGSFLFSKGTTISVQNASQKPAAKYLSDLFQKAAGFPISILENKENTAIVFIKDDTIKPEAYHLEVTPKKISIKKGLSNPSEKTLKIAESILKIKYAVTSRGYFPMYLKIVLKLFIAL